MRKIRFFFALTVALSLIATQSCDKTVPEDNGKEPGIENQEPENKDPEDQNQNGNTGNNQNPEPPAEPEIPTAANDGTYVVNGAEHMFKSAAVMLASGRVTIAATPSEGYTDMISIMTASDLQYFFAGMSQDLIGKELNLMTETGDFTIYSTIADAVIKSIAPGNVSEITKGSCLLTEDDGVYTLKVGVILADGTTVAVNFSAEAEKAMEITNEISIDGNVSPVTAAFYKDDGKRTYMNFTASDIKYYNELDAAECYIRVLMANSLMTAEETGVEGIGENTFSFIMKNNTTGELITFNKSELDGVEGSFYAKHEDEGCYAVVFDFTVDGRKFRVSYQGEFTHEEKTAADEEQIFSYEDTHLLIDSAELAEGDTESVLTFNLQNGETVSVKMPASYFDGNEHLLENDPSITIRYGTTIFNSAGGSIGAVRISVDKEAGSLDAFFTNYDNCELYYKGNCTIK